MNYRRLDETTLVAGQLLPEDLAALRAQGVMTIVNNRPDDEEPGQPSSGAMAAAAHAAGLTYHHIPVGGGLSANQVAAMAEALDGPGTTLAFCKSGTRSTYLWALARASRGADAAELERGAREAGYDLTPIRMYLG